MVAALDAAGAVNEIEIVWARVRRAEPGAALPFVALVVIALRGRCVGDLAEAVRAADRVAVHYLRNIERERARENEETEGGRKSRKEGSTLCCQERSKHGRMASEGAGERQGRE